MTKNNKKPIILRLGGKIQCDPGSHVSTNERPKFHQMNKSKSQQNQITDEQLIAKFGTITRKV